MMSNDAPLAYFITWTVYGTWLQGDPRGWCRRREGIQEPQPLLAQWQRQRLKHQILLLSAEQRFIVEQECQKHCDYRDWQLWAINARSNHVHVVVTALEHPGNTVRDQLKANCTRGLREHWSEFRDRPIWTVGGDCRCVNSEEELATVCHYVLEEQD